MTPMIAIRRAARALPSLALLAAVAPHAAAQTPRPPHVAAATVPDSQRPLGTLRAQAARQQRWLAERMETVLPRLMREHGLDMWVVPMREYNEDPVFTSLVGPTTFAALLAAVVQLVRRWLVHRDQRDGTLRMAHEEQLRHSGHL